MKILVTGGSGLLGQFVVDELLPDHEVGVLDIKPPHRDVLYHDCSILDLDGTVAAVKGYDRIIHLAGIDDGIEVEDYVYFSTNVQGAWNVLHAAELAGISKVVLASSCAAFSIGSDNPPDYLPFDEAHPLRPNEGYSLSKELLERCAASFTRRGLDTICLRPTLILRPAAAPSVVTALNGLGPNEGGQGIETGEPPYPSQHLPSIRTYVTSEDTARAFRMAVTSDLKGHHVFIVSAQDTLGGVNTLDMVAKVYGKTPEVRDGQRYHTRSDASPHNTDLIFDKLGWRAEDDWEAVLKRVRANLSG